MLKQFGSSSFTLFTFFAGCLNGISHYLTPSAPSWDSLIHLQRFCRRASGYYCIPTVMVGMWSPNSLPTCFFFPFLYPSDFIFVSHFLSSRKLSSLHPASRLQFFFHCRIILSFSTGWTGAGLPVGYNGMFWFPPASLPSTNSSTIHRELAFPFRAGQSY